MIAFAGKCIYCTFAHHCTIMGYLILATLLSTAIFIVFRLFKKFGIDNLQAIVANYIVAAVTGFLLYEKETGAVQIVQAAWFPLILVIGLAFIGVFFLFALSAQKVGVAVTAVSSYMSVVIPTAAGFIMFGDAFSLQIFVAIVLALLALYLALAKEQSPQKRMWPAIVLPLVIFLGTGANDLLMKVAQDRYPKDELPLMVATIFSVALIIGVFIVGIRLLNGKVQLHAKSWLAGIVLGLINFGSTYFLLRSMEFYSSSTMFPIRNTGVVGLSALAGLLLFGEKLSPKNWIGIFLAIISIVLITTG